MITNTGKSIIGKYMIGQAPAYASYIAVGCGPNALQESDTLGDYSAKQSLDMEMFRVPIVSRGFVSDDAVDSLGNVIVDELGNPQKISQVVFTAELPSEERYEITEVGIFSAGANTIAGAQDSRTVFTFSADEGWTANGSAINTVSAPLDNLDTPDNVIRTELGSFFFASANNRIFSNPSRSNQFERGRFLNSMALVAGNTSALINNSGSLSIDTGVTSQPLQLTNTTVSIGKNAPSDELRMALSVIRKDGGSSAVPKAVYVMLEFSDGSTTNPQYARMNTVLVDGQDGVDFASNRYFVSTSDLGSLEKSSAFSWNSVNTANVYISVIDTNDEYSDQFYVSIDALRIENITTVNPLYGMTGYSVIRTTDGQPVIKLPNTSGMIEFRFVMDVG